MKRPASKVALAAGLLALGLAQLDALATIIAGFQVSGHITSISGVSSVSIDGHLFIIRAGSPAVQQMSQYTTGQVVDVYLDGPPTSSASEVIAISAHSDQTGQ